MEDYRYWITIYEEVASYVRFTAPNDEAAMAEADQWIYAQLTELLEKSGKTLAQERYGKFRSMCAPAE